MQLVRPSAPRALISLVPLVDVLLILLVFFMVTSTYLDLDMIPAVDPGEDAAAVEEALEDGGGASPPPVAGTGAAAPRLLLIRLAPDGRVWLRGRVQTEAELSAALEAHVAATPEATVSVLASPRAEVQALVSLMDLATEAGIGRLQVLRTDTAGGEVP